MAHSMRTVQAMDSEQEDVPIMRTQRSAGNVWYSQVRYGLLAAGAFLAVAGVGGVACYHLSTGQGATAESSATPRTQFLAETHAEKAKGSAEAHAENAKGSAQAHAEKTKGSAQQDTQEADHPPEEAPRDTSSAKAETVASSKAKADTVDALYAQAKQLKGKAEAAQDAADVALKAAGVALEAAGQEAAGKAQAAQQVVDNELKEAAEVEKKAFSASASHRICLDVPGARLQHVSDAEEFPPLAIKKDVSTAESCRAWCSEHEDCVQMVFSSGDSKCELFAKATTQVSHWRDEYSSSLCGDATQKSQLEEMVEKVKAQKPTIPPVVDCSWSGDDCGKTKCCNNVACQWDFSGCKSYSCYQKEDSAQCMETASWNSGAVVGGARVARKIEAGKGVTLQGTSLFCFMVVNWKGAEGELANNIKDKKLGIYQCDAHTILSGWETSKTPWATLINADAFTKLWQQLQKDKVYLQHDWTVKVDVDTVFFPNVLKMHLVALKTPQGSRVYIKNMDYKFQFMGALEVLTREAVELFFEKGGQCAGNLLKAHPKAGEDFYMKTCLDAIGADSQEDFKILRDANAGDACAGGGKGPCSDGWTAAYHFFRDVNAWNTCHAEALKAQADAPKAGSSDGEIVEETLPHVAGAESTKALGFLDETKGLVAQAGPDLATAKSLNKTGWKNIIDAHADLGKADEHIADKVEDMSDARALEQGAAQKITDAKTKATNQGMQQLELAESKMAEAEADQDQSESERKAAVDAEEHALSAVANQRICLDLPGTRLSDTKPLTLTTLLAPMDTHSAELCREFCHKNQECKQAVYSAEDQKCSFFSEASDKPAFFNDKVNSTYCGSLDEKDSLVDRLNKVFKAKPWVPPVRKCAWAGDNCLESECCANVPVPDAMFKKFEWYTCYKKDEFYGACHLGPAPGNWNGTILGHMGTREVPKAPEGVLVQGTSLFCFAVVMWNAPAKAAWASSEAELATNINVTKRSIFQCDEYAFFEGSALGYGDGSSINNIDSFVGAWAKVRADGRWKKHDWVVKVDCDAVFFPDRLKMHLKALRTPQGSRVYLKNINFKFQFLGAIEVFTKEAIELYFDKSHECSGKVGHQGGEDYYMEACMDGIGIDHQTDFQLLYDKYAAIDSCADPWVVAFHFYKAVSMWNDCWQQAHNAAKFGHKAWAALEH